MIEVSLEKMLAHSEENMKNHAHCEGNLVIFEILLKDHDSLRNIILPRLAYDVLRFLKFSNLTQKRVQ